MRTEIIVHPRFDQIWPFAADHVLSLLSPFCEVALTRLSDREPVSSVIDSPAHVRRLLSLGSPINGADLDVLSALEEAFVTDGYQEDGASTLLESRGVRQLSHPSEGFWGQSVSEFALGLTIGALRRIPQTHRSMITSHDAWNYPQEQFGDDPRFTNGTVHGKRIRIVGAGNIASRFASFTHALGADVAAWDPFASEPAFHRSGSRREWHLDALVKDAEIFVPMVPLMPSTEGLITADHIRALPHGCLVVLATRANICDMTELRRRVLANELSLAADVFDTEPLPLDDALLGKPNVVHTPHNAGRTKESNESWARLLVVQFAEYVAPPAIP